MSSTVSEPLNLEDQCLLHLICHLEDYLPETLASLPLHLRRRLILNLPVADVCQLENTVITAGIDVEDAWKKITMEFDRRRSDMELQCSSFDIHFEDELAIDPVTLVGKHIFSDHPYLVERAKEILFCAIGCLGVTNWDGIHWDGIQDPFAHNDIQCPFLQNSPTPYRYARYFSEECQHMELLSFLVEKCKCTPSQFVINSRLIDAIVQSKDHDRYANLLQRFLSRVQELELVPDPIFWCGTCALSYSCTEETKAVTQFIFKQILVNPQTTLSKLKLSMDWLHRVAKLLSATDSDTACSHPNIPYGGLTSIDVHHVEPCANLNSVILYQRSLTSVRLSRGSTFYSVSLVSTLGQLFHHPQFRELQLADMTLNWEGLGVLIPSFLSASSENGSKTLNLFRVTFPEGGTPPKHVAITTDSRPQKALDLNGRNDMSAFLQWLSAYNYTSLLSSFTLDLTACPRVLRFPVKPTISLQHLKLCNVRFSCKPSPDKVFTNIFQYPHLKSVCLWHYYIAHDRLLPALTRGLRRQLSVGSLQKLSLKGNELGASPESDLQEFFDVLYSLPQLSDLQVNLGLNGFTPRHHSLMHNSWERNAGHSGQHLKAIEVREQ